MSLTVPGLPSLLFLGYLFLYFPWMALRTTRRVRAAVEGALPSRTRIWTGSLILAALLLAMSLVVGSGFGYEAFAWPAPRPIHVVYAAVALAVLFLLRAGRRAARTAEERRGMFVHAIAPRTPGEAALWATTVLAASVAEEVAYRGVAMSILWHATGNPYLSAVLCSLAFALAHAVQGWRSMVTIYVIAHVMHGLVALTGSLVPAMTVHALYDFLAGWAIRREALRNEAAPAA